MPTVFTPTILYMLVTNYNIDWERVNERTQSHPGEAIPQDRHGLTILHLACHRNAPPEIIFKLLKAHPTASRLKSSMGQTPLSIACCRRASLFTLEALVDAYPDAVWMADKAGIFPIFALWNSYVEEFGGEDILMSSILEMYGRKGDAASVDSLESTTQEDIVSSLVVGEECWDKVTLLLLRAWCCRVPTNHLSSSAANTTPVLHSAAAMPCPRSVVQIACQLYPNELLEKDRRGRLPLSIAAAAPRLEHFGEWEQNEKSNWAIDLKKRGGSVINVLLQECPEAARITDGSGRFALNIAIDSGKGWDEGVESLMNAAPEVLRTRDVVTNFYPFMLAAVNERASVNTVYQLLRSLPEVVQVGILR